MPDDKANSQQIDEEEQEEVEETEVQEESQEEASHQEESEQEVETTEEEASTEEEQEEEPSEPSRRENLRIQQLIKKMREQQSPTQQPQSQRSQNSLDYRQSLDADDEVYEKLESDREQYGQSRYSQGLSEAENIKFHTRLELDAPKVASKYKLLDPESNKFNPAVANALNEMFLTSVGYDPNTGTAQNPNIRYSEYIDGMMELIDAAASEKAEKSSKNIAKQAASTGLRPDGSSAKSLNLNKAPSDMSKEELNAAIMQGLSSLKKR